MTYVDEMKGSTHDDLKALATKHGAFESFLQDVQRLADKAWHNARAQGHIPSSIVGDAEKTIADLEQDGNSSEPAEGDTLTPGPTGEPAEGAQVEAGPTDEGQLVTTPAEPASPSSDGGFPTSNVGVVVNPDPAEGTSVPVE